MDAVEVAATDGQDPEPGREIMMRFMAAAEARDVDALSRLAHPEVEMEWPQSGEHFTGRDNALGALQAQEQKPEMAGEPRLLGSGDLWVAMVPLRYGEEIYHYVGIFELRDGLIARSTEFFGAPFPAAESRAQYADPR